MQKRILTSEEYNLLLDKLVKNIKHSTLFHRIKYIYGIPRGGLPIAVHLSHHLNLDFLEKFDDTVLKRSSTLIVDDIAHTGRTLEKLINTYITATLFYRDGSTVEPNFYIEKTDQWIVFPWEKIDEIPNREE